MISTLRLSGIKTLMALGLIALSFSSFSQFDTQFWMPPIWDIGSSGHNQPSELFITTPYPTTVNVHIESPDGISFVLDTTVISGNPLQVVLTTAFGQTTSENEIETNSGLIVTSDAPIQCVHKLSAQFNQTLVTLKGPNGLGTDFYCGSQTFNQNLNYNPDEYHFISVMALHDDTQISFDTPFDMYQSGPGDLPNPYVITLDQYETYLIHGNNPIEHVAGAHVTSDKEITVISGSTHTRVGSSTNADGGTDQLVPVELMGDEFVIIKGQNSDPTDYAIVVATEDDTDVYIDGGGSPVANIDAGEYYNYFLSGSWGAPHYISTSKVSYVYHVTGASNNDEVGMSAIPQIQCTGSRYIEFSKFTVNTSNQILNVIAPADAEPTLELNNIPYSSVPGAVSNSVPGLPGWTAVSFPNSSLDANNIITSDGFFHAGFLTGTGSQTGTYGFLSGFDDAFEFLDPFNGLPTTVYMLDTLCPGESIDHCIQVFSCAFDHNIIDFEGNEGTVVITPPTSPYDTCFSYTAPFTFTGSDTVTFTVDNVFGFDGEIDIVFHIVDPDTPIDAGPVQELCSESTGTLSAVDPDPLVNGYWSVLEGGSTIVNPNSPTTSVTNLALGTNTFLWTQDYGCSSNFDITQIIVYDGTAPAADAGSDQSLCTDDNSTIMTANDPLFTATGTWEITAGNATIWDINDPTALVTNLGIGINIFEWNIDNGPCPGGATVDEMIISVYDHTHPDADAGVDQEYCSDAFVQADVVANTAIIPAVGQWSLVSGSGTIDDPLSPTTFITGCGLGENIFEWQIDNGPCGILTDTISIFIYDSDQASPNAGTDVEYCTEIIGHTMNATPISFPASGTWTLVSGAGVIVDNNNPTTEITNIGIGENVFQWTLDNGPCGNSGEFDTVTIMLFDATSPIADAGPDQEFCVDAFSITSLEANTAVFPATGVWTVTSGSGVFDDDTNPTTTVTGLSNGSNIFQWTIDNGPCALPSIDFVEIIIYTMDQVPAYAGPDVEFCTPTSTYTMQAIDIVFPSWGEWTLISGTGTISDVNNPNAEISGLGIGENIYRWTVINGPCPPSGNYDEVSIFIHDENLEAANAGPDQEMCSNLAIPVDATMDANTPVFPAIGSWTTIQGGGNIADANDPNTLITLLPVGENIFEWTYDNGPCTPGFTSDQVSVFVYPIDQDAANAGPDQDACSDSGPLTLAANSATFPASGEWTLVSGSASFVDSTDPTTDVSGLSVGENVLEWTINNGPCNPSETTDTITITVYDETQTTADAGTDQEMCSDAGSIALSANNASFPASGVWTVISGSGSFTDDTDPGTTVSSLSVGENIFEWTVSNGPCSPAISSDQVSVFVYDENAPLADAGDDQEICSLSPTTSMDANTPTYPATGYWELVSGSGTIVDLDDPNTTINSLAVGENIFRWTIDNAPCIPATSQDLVSIYVYDDTAPIADAGDDQEYCTPVASTTLEGNAAVFPATGAWTLISGSGNIVSPSNPNTLVTGLTVGENIFEWTINSGVCPDAITTDQISIFIFDENQELANAGDDQNFCTPVSTTNLDGNSADFPANGVWTLISGTGSITDPTDPNTGITGMTIGENIFEWTVFNGPCSPAVSSDQVSIFIYDDTAADADAGPDQEMCTPTTSTTLAGNSVVFPASGEWTLVSGSGSITDPSDPSTGVTGLAIGENVFQWSIDNLTCSGGLTTDEVSIFVFFDGQEIADAGEDQEICTPQSTVTMAGNSVTFPAVGTWALISGTGNITDANDPNTGITGLTVGTNVFEWTIVNGPCGPPTTDQVSILVFDGSAPVADAGIDQELCSPLPSTTMAANSAIAPAQGTWTLVSGSGTITDANDPNSGITALGIGVNTFQWTLDYSVCGSTSDLVDITVFDSTVPASDAGADQEFCSPVSTATMAATAIAAPGYGTWTLISGSGSVTEVNNPNSGVTGLAIGENIFQWEIYNSSCLIGPSTTDLVSIFIFDMDLPFADAGADQEFCSPTSTTTMTATAAPFPASGNWVLISGSGNITDPSDATTGITGLAIGENIFEWTVSNGPCTPATTNDQVSIFIFDDNAADADAGSDQDLCTPTTSTTLDGNSPVVPATGEWTLISGSGSITDPSDPTSGVTGLGVGENVFQWEIDNLTCSGGLTSDQVSIFVYFDGQLDADAGIDQEICTPQSTVTMAANAVTFPGEGTWTLISGTGNITDANDPSTGITGLTVGTNVFEWTIDNGPCGAPTADQVSILVFDGSATVADAGIDQELCSPLPSTTMAANSAIAPAQGTWTLVSGSGTITDANDPNSGITALGIGVNTFQWTLDYSVCGSTSDLVDITVFDSTVPASDAGVDQEFCSPTSTATMAATAIAAPGYGTWTLVSGSGSVTDVNSPNSGVTGLAIGENIFQWEIYNSSCLVAPATIDLVSIIIFDMNQPAADAGADQEFCSPTSTTTMTATAAPFPASGSWTLISGSGSITDSSDPTTGITGLAIGENIFEWTISNGPCTPGTTSDQVSIFIFDDNAADADAGIDQDLCTPTTSATLAGNSPVVPATGEWTLISGSGSITDPSDPTSGVTGLGVGENVFQWEIDNLTCSGGLTSDQVSIFVYFDEQLDADAGEDQDICTPQSSTFLEGNSVTFPATGQWTLVSGTGTIVDATDPGTEITGLAIGVNVFQWEIDNVPCAAGITTDQVSITIFDGGAPQPDAGADQELCSPTSTTFMTAVGAVPPGEGTWSLISGSGAITDVNDPLTEITGLAIGVNVFEWSLDYSTCGTQTDLVSIIVYDSSVPAANAGVDQEFCSPINSSTMTADAIASPGEGTWTLFSGSGTFTDENDPTTDVDNLTIGENIFVWEVYNGPCLLAPLTTDTMSIFIFDNLQANADAGEDQIFCSPISSTTLEGNNADFPSSGVWTLVSGTGTITDAIDPATTVTAMSIGENIFEWTIDNGPCGVPTSDQVSIFIYDDNADDADAGPDQELCTPTLSTTMAGNSPVLPATGLWTLISGSGTITDATDPNTGITALAVGENIFEWTIDNDDCSGGMTSDLVSIFVFDNTQATADAGADQDLCTPVTATTIVGNSVTFPGTGMWTLVSGTGTITTPTGASTTITDLAIGINVFEWTISNGPCVPNTTSDQVVITVFDGGAAPVNAGLDQEHCSPTSTTFMTADAAVPPGEGTWTLISGSGAITDVNDPLTEITGLAIGVNVFEWSIDYSTCGTQTDLVSIIIYDNSVPASNAGADQEFCSPTNSSTMTADAIASPGEGTWTLFSGSGTFTDENDPSTVVSNLTIGENIFVWEVYNGPCLLAPLTTDTMSIFIFDNLQASADAGEDQIFCSPISSTTLEGNDADFPASGEWTLVSGTGTITDSSDPTSTVTAMSIGENIFEWTVDNGPCGLPSSDQVSIFIYDDNADDADAGPDQELCTPTISTTMAANSPVAPATGLWELISGSGTIASPSNPVTSISGLAVGENVFEWTIDNDDCSNGMTSDLISIFVFDTNQGVADAGPDQDLCTPVTATTLIGNSLIFPATGEWTLVSGTGTITTPTGESTTVTDLGIGINVFEWTISNGPCVPGTTSDQVIISVFDGNAEPVNAGLDQELCTPTTSTFMTADAAVNPGVGTWSLISGTGNITDPNDPLTEITGLTLGVNVFEWSVDYSTCGTQTDQVTITIYDSTVPASNAGVDQDLCAPVSTTTMAADDITAPGYGTWSLFSGNGTIIDLNDPNTSIENLTIGENIFVWEVYNGPCLLAPLTTDTVSIFIFDNLQESADAGEGQDICTPQTSTFLEGNSADFPAEGTWTLVSGGGTIVDSNNPNTEVTDLPVGENVFEWNVVNGSCPGGDTSDEVSIFIFDENQLDADAGEDQDFCTPFSSLNLDGNAITFPAVGTWELLNGTGTIADPNDPNTLVTNLDVGENIFEWTVDNGPCGEITTDIVSIFIYNQFNEDANAGLDQELCTPDTTTNLTGNSPIFPASGNWTLVSGTGDIDNPADGNTLVTGLTVGENVFVWTVDNGPCANGITADTVSVFIFDDLAPLAFAGDDQEYCTPTSSTLLNADTPIFPGAGVWTLVSGTGTIISPTDPNSQVTDLEVGENIFEWEVYNGPCNLSGSTDQVSVFIFDETQESADAGPDQDLCSPQFSTSLSANSVIFPATGTWTLVQGTGILSDANDPTTFVTGLSVGDNIFEWTIENGPCDDSVTVDSVTISVFENELEDADAGEDQEFCLPDNFATLDGSDLIIPATGLWTQIQGGGNILDPTSDITAVTNLPIGENIFVWSVDNGPCGSSVDTVSVFIFDPEAAIADAGPNQDFCTPTSTTAMAASTAADPGGGTWELIVGDGTIADENDPETGISGLTIGENIFSWTIYNGPCADPTVDFVSIFIFDENAPAADAGPDLEICLPLDSINMNANAAIFPASGAWSLIGGAGTILDVNDENALITDLELGTNTFVWSIDNNPCANGITSDTVNVFVFENEAALAFAGIDQEFCSPTATTVLDADDLEDPNTGTWTLVNGTGLFGDPTDPNTIVSGMTVGINEYEWSVYNGPCADSLSTDIVQVLIFDETQEAADAGEDQELCLPTNSTLMNGNALISPATGMWTLISGAGTIVSPTDPNTQIMDLELGINIFEWTIDNGPCEDAITSDQVSILVFEEDADIADAGEDIEICTPENCVTLNAAIPSIPTTGTWTWVQGNGTISDINDPNAEVCALTVGHYILEWSIYNGPCNNNNSFDFVDIWVYDASAEPAYAGEDQELCWPEDSTVLEADTTLFPAEGTWEIINGSGALSDINDPAADLSDMSIGITELTWTVYNGPCADPTIDTVMISIFNPDSPDAYAGEDQHFCSPFAGTTMEANTPLPPATGTWTLVSGAATITNNSLPNTTVFDLGFGENILVWSIYNGACANGITTDTVSLFLNDLSVAEAYAGLDQQYCGALDSLQMDGSETIGNTAVGTWTILEGGGDFFNVNNEHTFVYDIPTGMNTYLWTVDNDECGVSTDSVNILIFDPAIDTAFAGISQVICEDDFSPFNLNGNEYEYPATGYWNIVDGPIEIEDANDPSSLVLDLGSIDVPLTEVLSTLSWTIDNGVCGTSTDTVSFILEDCLTIEIPDAFSPNGDGINDLFEIPNLFKYPNNSIKIFNRWGSLVYEAAPYQEDWDGRSQHSTTIGDELPVSTYYYILDLGDGSEGLAGYIYLKR